MTNTAPTTSRRAPGRDRNHHRPGRPRQIKVRYTHEEYATIASAARDTGLTPTGYVAETALAAATNTQTHSTAPWRTALLELMEARTQVRRIGTNINQATAAINATGEPPVWLRTALAITGRAVAHLDEAATAVTDVAHTTVPSSEHPEGNNQAQPPDNSIPDDHVRNTGSVHKSHTDSYETATVRRTPKSTTGPAGTRRAVLCRHGNTLDAWVRRGRPAWDRRVLGERARLRR